MTKENIDAEVGKGKTYTCQDRRRLLTTLLLRKSGVFTREEITNEFVRQVGDRIVDGLVSIRGFFREREESGLIRWVGGGYVNSI